MATRAPIDLGFGRHVDELVATAIGDAHRSDPVAPRTGGPAGNARLTAWLGIALLLLFAVEGVTLLSLHQLINIHLLIGGVLIPLSFAKTATTGWRIVRYYTGHRPYIDAGPPPLVLRLLGPLVILTAFAVLGTGLALVAVGPSSTFQPLFALGGFSVSALTLHQGAFILWFAATAVHVLARTVPAAKLMGGGSDRGGVPGAVLRGGTLLVTTALAIVCGVLVLHSAGAWSQGWANGSFR